MWPGSVPSQNPYPNHTPFEHCWPKAAKLHPNIRLASSSNLTKMRQIFLASNATLSGSVRFVSGSLMFVLWCKRFVHWCRDFLFSFAGANASFTAAKVRFASLLVRFPHPSAHTVPTAPASPPLRFLNIFLDLQPIRPGSIPLQNPYVNHTPLVHFSSMFDRRSILVFLRLL